MIDYNCYNKKHWIIKPETSKDNMFCAFGNHDYYGNDLNHTKKCKLVMFQNPLKKYEFIELFKIRIRSEYGQIQHQHLEQFVEDPALRHVYALWRENLDKIYSRNQLFTLEQKKQEEMKQMDKKEADGIRKYIDETTAICLSMEFRRLSKKYKYKSVKYHGWMNKGEIKIMITDDTYNKFYKEWIEGRTDKDLCRMKVKEVVMEFYEYYRELLTELCALDGFGIRRVTLGHLTYYVRTN